MNAETIPSFATAAGGGFFVGLLIGYAIKKVIKIMAIVVGLFFAGLAYFQYQQILSVNWDKLQSTSQSTISALANATTQFPVSNLSSASANYTTALALTNLGIPFTGSMAMGFGIGFMKG